MTFVLCLFQKPEDLWAIHSKPVYPRPHKKDSASWAAIQKVQFLSLRSPYVILDLFSSLSNRSPIIWLNKRCLKKP